MKERKNNENKIFFAEDASCFTTDIEIEFDVERIRELTFAKLHGETEERQGRKMKKTSIRLLIAAALILAISGTVFAANYYGLFSNIFVNADILQKDEVLSVGESAENEDMKITVEQMVSDGYEHSMIVSIEPKTKKAKKVLKQEYALTIDPIQAEKGTIDSNFPVYSYGFWKDNTENGKKYYEVRCSSDKRIDKEEITWRFQWRVPNLDTSVSEIEAQPIDNVVTRVEPIQITVLQEKTLEGEKNMYFSKNFLIKRMCIHPIGAYIETSDTYEHGTLQSVALVFRDGSEELLYNWGTSQTSAMSISDYTLLEKEKNEENGILVSYQTMYYYTGCEKQYMGFSHIIRVNDIAGVRINGVMYPLIEEK